MPEGLPIVDAFMGIPVPESAAVKKYEFLQRQLRDEGSKAMAMPAEYMFKGVPKYGEIDDPVELLVSELDRFGISMSMLGVATSDDARRAVREHPDRFFAAWDVDPNRGMEAVRDIEAGVRDFGVKAVIAFPAGLYPQVPINDKKWYPIYAKCVELDIPICVCAGIPGPRVPFAPQDVAHIDEVCWYFPELKFVTRHGCEPWTDLAVKLLLKWPNLYYSTSAFAPKHYPPAIVDFANTRGADKIIYAGYYPAGLTLDRIFSELPDVPFRDHVWPKFLHENARRVFQLPEAEPVSDNPAFDAALAAGGAIDTATGIPKSREEMFEYYSYIRDQARDAESKAGEGGLEMPAGYMFKEVPKWEADELGDPVEFLLAEMDRHDIRKVVTGVEDPNGARAVREYPDRFAASIHVDPNHGMEEVRKIQRFADEWDLKAVGAFPAGLYPQVAINDKKFFPIYAKCVELDLVFGSTMGVPGPRIPFAPQDVAHLDEVCWYFPELRFVTRHGCEPWTDLAVKLMLKWPNLFYSTTAFAPKHYPKDVIDFANTRGADKIIWSGYFPAGLTYDRIFSELPNVPFRDHVWPKFLHENATRVFKLDS